ncbi:MAG: endonuclease III [Clostridiales bacterium]|nr:endonuclease III [Clostridiales bacterium]
MEQGGRFVPDTGRVLAALGALYPQARAELNFSNPFETLIATILAAQCTDARVNIVTEALFPMYPNARAMAALTPEQLEPLIQTCGLYHSKARNIVATCNILVEQYGGEVPADRKALEALPGVGQKTAGVVRMAAFGADEIPVDTHVFRVANRIGLADAKTAEATEAALRAVLPEGRRAHAHHLLIWHGRRMCHARKPACQDCPLRDGLCRYTRPAEE